MLCLTRVVLPGKGAGWTVWGGNGQDGHDYLLPVGSGFALFDTFDGLRGHVRRDRAEHLLSRTADWPKLVRDLATGAPAPDDVYDFRLDRLAAWTPEWTGSDLISAIDLVWDLGAQFADAYLIDVSANDGALRGVYDEHDPSSAAAVRVAKVAKKAVAHVVAHAVWNPGRTGMDRAG